jgi:ABC-type bacteriocin/lantibiotic exporter with double-glycine peptidase domain
MRKSPISRWKKAKGGFFATKATFPYVPRGVLYGQATEDSCVPACTRMLIHDLLPEAQERIEYSESYLRIAFKTDRSGSSLKAIPTVLSQAGVLHYVYRADLQIEELTSALQKASVIVRLSGNNLTEGHAVIVDAIENDLVAIRDPLPRSSGSTYRIRLADFLPMWIPVTLSSGQAVIMVD